MTGAKEIIDEQGAAALADLLNGSGRRRPVVVVTIPAGGTDPWIDVEEITREAGDLADVYLMPTGPLTWEFSRHMADATEVYGGAGRVYPVGHEWTAVPARSPLRFAFGVDDGRLATQRLISDALRMANTAGLIRSLPAKKLRLANGVVKATVAGRALVDIGGGTLAAVAEELTVEEVPIDRLLLPGQRVAGWFDPESNRLDITSSLRPADAALASYSVGDVVLGKVVMVEEDRAQLVLYPKTDEPAVSVPVDRADVTMNPADDLRTLMTLGEVIAVRVSATGPRWALVLHDVNDDEPVVAAPPLLAGGPPWLVEELAALEPVVPDTPEAAALPRPAPVPHARGHEIVSEPAPCECLPTPAIFDKTRSRRPAHAAPSPAPTPAVMAAVRQRATTGPAAGPTAPSEPALSTKLLLRKIDALNAEVKEWKREHEALRAQLRAGQDEHDQLRYLLDQSERRANRAENDLRTTRARLRRAGKSRQGPARVKAPRFADREQGFRYLVLTSWATRTGPDEQAGRPLPDYLIGPEFLDSLERLEGIRDEKVADVVFEIVTGLAAQTTGRELHQLRTGPGGGDPVRTRSDGAVAWRASLQVGTPSARRVHYWVLPNRQIELSRVVTHDDTEA